jgi:uncharacterized alkaline shock family protein YloU
MSSGVVIQTPTSRGCQGRVKVFTELGEELQAISVKINYEIDSIVTAIIEIPVKDIKVSMGAEE